MAVIRSRSVGSEATCARQVELVIFRTLAIIERETCHYRNLAIFSLSAHRAERVGVRWACSVRNRAVSPTHLILNPSPPASGRRSTCCIDKNWKREWLKWEWLICLSAESDCRRFDEPKCGKSIKPKAVLSLKLQSAHPPTNAAGHEPEGPRLHLRCSTHGEAALLLKLAHPGGAASGR